ncbi:MAG: YfiR/HmsC family protein, partial [Bacteroidales bacterium]
MKNTCFFALLIGICLFTLTISAQETFTHTKRAKYIFSFAKYVTWPENTKDYFSIAIIAQDSLLYYKLKQEADHTQTLHEKPIDIKIFNTIDDITPSDILFIKNSGTSNIELVREKITHTHTLLLTENFPFRKSMINFIVAHGKRNYEINLEALEKANLTIHPLLIANAIKTKENWEKLYEQTEQKLVQEQTKTEAQTKLIQSQSTKIKEKEKHITHLQDSIQNQQKALTRLNNNISLQQQKLQKTLIEIANRREKIDIQKLQLDKLSENISEQQKVLHKQSDKLHTQDKKIVSQFDTIQHQNMLIIIFSIFLIIILILAFIVYKQFKITQKINSKLHSKNIKLENQKNKIAKQHTQITDSITYAQRIQQAILPPHNIISKTISDYFILLKPRSIVSGDFYWMTETKDLLIFSAADCTGHGVPGAFMSLLGITFLQEIVHEKKITSPDAILTKLRTKIIHSINNQESKEEHKDGMDMAICTLNKQDYTISYAGAYNPLYIIKHNGELEEIKADKMPVGLSPKNDIPFTIHKRKLEMHDCLYMFSDGYVDQFGGPKNKKFMSGNFKKLLQSIHKEPMETQKKILQTTIEEWMGDTEQIDDIVIMGLKYNS